ncbi:MAG: amidase [Actinomycetes bacterium]
MSQIAAIRDALSAGTVSCHEVVEASLRRIADLDPALNAVTVVRDEAALAEASALDVRVAAGVDPGPLAGIPVLVKDLEDVEGMTTTMGSSLFADSPPASSDSTVPARLRAAGAIVVGKSNLPEFAVEGFTDNLVYGPTGNPWRPDLSPGGSSGGSAAALASGMVVVATATDGGGSIRIPAAFCGLVGLKPTNGVVGRWPAPDWIDFSTEGPFATTVADLRLLMTLVRGPVAGDPSALPNGVPIDSGGPGRRPGRLLTIDRFGPHGPLPTDVQGPFDRAVADMSAMLGSEPVHVRVEDLWPAADPDDDWFVTAAAEHVARFGRAWVTDHLDRMHPSTQAFMQWGLRTTVDEYLAARRRRFDYVRALDQLLGDDGVLLSPTVASAGWTKSGRPLDAPDDASALLAPEVFNTALQNITGHPAVSVPAGRAVTGLPFGLQVTGPRFADALLLDVAAEWERTHPWPTTAPGYQPFTESLGLGTSISRP